MFRGLAILAILFSSVFLFVKCDECDSTVCANGGECRNGDCICADGIARPFCVIDTCFAPEGCKNGHCEYGFCVCDKNWDGEFCEIRTYRNHSGDYFGGFECNETYISTATIEIRELNQVDTFEFYEQDLRYDYKVGFTTIDQFVVPRQKVVTGGNEVFVEGSGEIIDGTITYSVHYTTLYSNGSIDDTYCVFTGNKR